MDPDPGGPKTCGSGFGSGTMSLSIVLLYFIFTYLQHGGRTIFFLRSSVADTDPEPDPYVFGPSGSFHSTIYHKVRIVRKTLIPIVLRLLYGLLSLKNDVM